MLSSKYRNKILNLFSKVLVECDILNNFENIQNRFYSKNVVNYNSTGVGRRDSQQHVYESFHTSLALLFDKYALRGDRVSIGICHVFGLVRMHTVQLRISKTIKEFTQYRLESLDMKLSALLSGTVLRL